MLHFLYALILGLLLHADIATAQTTPSRDDVAVRLKRARQVANWSDAIRDSLVAPQWLKAGDRLVFWDAIGSNAGTWVLVDAAQGTQSAVIGPGELRTQLAALTGKDAALPPQMPFVLAPDDRGLIFGLGGMGFRVDFADSRVRRVAAGGLDSLLLNGAILSPRADRAAVQQNEGFAVIDAAGRDVIERTGTSDRTWQLPEKPWSPDGRLAVWEIDQSAVHRIPVVDYTKAVERTTMVPYAKVGTPIATARLHLFDPATGGLTPVKLSEGEGYDWLVGWRSDKAALILHLTRDGKRLDLLAVASDGGVQRLMREERHDTKVADLNFAVDGWRSQVTPLARGQGFLWMSERDGWRHVYHYDEGGRLVRQVTRGAFPVARIDRVVEDGTLLVTAAGDPAAPYDELLYRVARNGTLRPVANEPGIHLSLPSPSGRYLVDSRSSWTTPRVRDLRRINGTVATRLTTADAQLVPATGRTRSEPIKVLAADGTTSLYGALHRPFGFDPARRYPVVAYIYGGPFGTVVSRTFTGSTMTRSAETLAAAGFVVVAIDVRGSAGRSKEFSDTTYRRIGETEIADYVAGLRQLSVERSWMDLSRVGIHGHSWGGYFAIRAMLTAPDVFKAGYAGAPGSIDEDALVNEPDMGLLAANPTGYAASSNIGLAGRLASPLRIMHGTADTSAPLSSSMRFVDALIRANKPVELLAMPGVGHNPEGAANDYYRDDVIRFFLRTLGQASK